MLSFRAANQPVVCGSSARSGRCGQCFRRRELDERSRQLAQQTSLSRGPTYRRGGGGKTPRDVLRLSDPDARVSPEAADFWRRAIMDVVTAPVMHSQPPGTTATTTIAEIALQHGFLNLGRFSGYCRALFDEYPSETFGKRYPGRGRQRPAGPVATSSAASPASRSIASLHSNYARY